MFSSKLTSRAIKSTPQTVQSVKLNQQLPINANVGSSVNIEKYIMKELIKEATVAAAAATATLLLLILNYSNFRRQIEREPVTHTYAIIKLFIVCSAA